MLNIAVKIWLDRLFFDGDFRRVCEILPGAFGLLPGEMAVENDPAVFQYVGAAAQGLPDIDCKKSDELRRAIAVMLHKKAR